MFANIVVFLLFPDAGYLCIPAVLPILKEVADGHIPEDHHQENQDDPVSVVLGVVANIFQKIIELLARRLKREPEEGKQVRRHLIVYCVYVAHYSISI